MSSPSKAAGAARKPAGQKSPPAKTGSRKTTSAKKVAKPAETSTPNQITDPSSQARALALLIEQAVAAGRFDALEADAQQALFGALLKLYGAGFESGERRPIINGPTGASSTDVMIACGALLKASNLQVFELGMWQSWTGN